MLSYVSNQRAQEIAAARQELPPQQQQQQQQQQKQQQRGMLGYLQRERAQEHDTDVYV
jgi:hypothetical protein